MKLIVGGAFQGRRKWIKEQYLDLIRWMDLSDPGVLEPDLLNPGLWKSGFPYKSVPAVTSGADDEAAGVVSDPLALFVRLKQDRIRRTEVLVNLEELLLQCIRKDQTLYSPEKMEIAAEAFAGSLFQINPDLVVVGREMGSGIVPAVSEERVLRELNGRVCTAVAQKCAEVYRVVCGIGTRIR